jgi:hypothetical protein
VSEFAEPTHQRAANLTCPDDSDLHATPPYGGGLVSRQRRAYGRYSAASLTLSIALPDVIKPFFMLPLLTVPGRRAISSVYGPAVWLSRTRSRYWCGASWS